jgi:phage terminase large subunit GpA-like protein
MIYKEQILEALRSGNVFLSNMKPSEWAEKNRVMPQGTPFPGPYSYDKTPYFKEIVDHLSPESPARIIAFMKGAQIGASAGVIENGLGWIIDQRPQHVLFLTGHADLAEESMSGRVDEMIDSCGLRPLIKANSLRKRNQRTGDTSKAKEFPDGSITAGSAGNHKLLRQRTVQAGFIDDFEAAKGLTKESGSTFKMIEQRFASSESKMKLYFISTPEVKQTSNIEPVYKLGDQRRYNVHCPCCHEPITLEWTHEVDEYNMAGITWKTDTNGRLIDKSVGYLCQKCGGFFTEKNKYEMNLNGLWVPTAEPTAPDYFSYQLSALYAAPGMFNWTHYVRDYIAANPKGVAKPELMQTFTNLCLGITYESKTKTTSASPLLSNIRDYPIGVIPEKVSIRDGNGIIVGLTMACDLGGFVEDGRVDWEIVAWSQSGTPYSVDQGSVGTFVNKENSMKYKADRAAWSYDLRAQNSVWPEITKIASKIYPKDTGTSMRPQIVGIDSGFFEKEVFEYIDSVTGFWCIGLKGKDVFKFTTAEKDLRVFKKGLARSKLYLIEVNKVKDALSDLMLLRWDAHQDDAQPVGFMNYPQQSDGKYSYKDYFKHFEAEHRILESDKDGLDVRFKWVKKSSSLQNHFWDVRIYNMALKDILAYEVCINSKSKETSWPDYVKLLLAY